MADIVPEEKQPLSASDGLDNLTAAQAAELARSVIDPTKTAASNPELFAAVTKVRKDARAAGASEQEVNRLVNIQTIRTFLR